MEQRNGHVVCQAAMNITKINRKESEEMGWKVEHFSKISRWVLKRRHFNKDLEKMQGSHRSHIETKWKVRQSQKQEYMWSLNVIFTANLFLNHQVWVFYGNLPLWVLWKCDAIGEGSHWTVLAASAASTLVHPELKAWDAIFICSELNVPMFEMNKVK